MSTPRLIDTPKIEKPCSKCGINPRKIGLSWCRDCINEKKRDKHRNSGVQARRSR